MNDKNKVHAIRRGQIYHIKSDSKTEPIGCEIWPDRPGIIISNALMNAKSKGVVEVVYLTLAPNKNNYTEHININSAGQPATALCDQIHTVDKSRLGAQIGNITPKEQQDIDRAILFNLFPNYVKTSHIISDDIYQEFIRYKEGYERLEATLQSLHKLTAI